MAITKLSITGNTTAVGISSTPIVVSLGNTAEATTVTPSGNITATSVQTALEQLDTIKVEASGGTLTNPSISGNVSVTGGITASSINLGDSTISDYSVSTWTPQINLGITFTTSYAKVVKIGNICHLSFKFTDIDTTSMTGNDSDTFIISGLPFTSAVDGIGLCKRFDWSSLHESTEKKLSIDINTTSIKVCIRNGYTNVTKADITQDVNDGVLVGSITYQV
jgi:hypothetical protein